MDMAQVSQKQAKVNIKTLERDLLVNKAEAVKQASAEAQEALETAKNHQKAKIGELERLKDKGRSLRQETEVGKQRVEELTIRVNRLRAQASFTRQRAEEAKASHTANASNKKLSDCLIRLRSSRRGSGFHGRLGSLGTVPDEYDVAITTACDSINDLVVDTVQQGQACIEFLREHDVRHVNFLALEEIDQTNSMKSIQTPENVPRLYDLITPKEPRFACAFYNALRDTLVAQKFSQAIRIAFGTRRWRVVTLTGVLIDSSGTMSGGGAKPRGRGMGSTLAPDTLSADILRKFEQDSEAVAAQLIEASEELRAAEAELEAVVKSRPQTDLEIDKVGLDVLYAGMRVVDAESWAHELKVEGAVAELAQRGVDHGNRGNNHLVAQMGVTGLWDILRPSGKLRSLTHIAVVDGFEANPANLRGLRIGIDASIWFFHAAYGREGENPELRTLFFRCAKLAAVPFLPLFIFDGPKRPKVKRGKRISGGKHWLVDSIKGIIEAFGFEWRMAPGEAEAELAYLNNIGVIDAVLSDDVDNFLFGAKMVIRNASANLSGNRKHSAKNTGDHADGNHSMVYTSDEILAHPSVRLTRGGLILIGLLSGGDYHPAGLFRCGSRTAHGLAMCRFGDELLNATQSLTRDELSDFLTMWRGDLCSELRTNSRGHLDSKKPSLAKAVPDSFPDIDILLSYTNPIISATDTSTHRTHTPPRWEHEPDLGKLAHLCELHFEWGLKNTIIKRFRTVMWPSIVLRALRCSALEAAPSKPLERHFSSVGVAAHDTGGDGDGGLQELIVKIHSSRMHAYTDNILEYRLEVAPAELVCLASAGIQGLRKPADTTYDVQPSETEEESSGDVDIGDTGKRRRKHGAGSPPEPDSHLRVWMPACMVRPALPDLVEQYEARFEAKHAKKGKKVIRPRPLPPQRHVNLPQTSSQGRQSQDHPFLLPPAKEARKGNTEEGRIPRAL